MIIVGKIILVDEIHTPDSSRYWIQSTYGNIFLILEFHNLYFFYLFQMKDLMQMKIQIIQIKVIYCISKIFQKINKLCEYNLYLEFLRLWFKDNCDPYKDKILPKAPENLVIELSR